MRIDPHTVQPGANLPSLVIEVSQERINQYADLSGDYNPLHVDPVFARQTPFGSTIAHGPLAAALLFQVVGDWLDSFWPSGVKFEFIFTAPVRAGDSVTAGGTVRERVRENTGELLIVDLRCTNQRGETVIVGTARVPLSD